MCAFRHAVGYPNFPNRGTEFTDAALQKPVTKPILNGFSLVILSLERTRT